ncbi:MAG: serine hydrolase [Rhodothermales bacterium]
MSRRSTIHSIRVLGVLVWFLANQSAFAATGIRAVPSPPRSIQSQQEPPLRHEEPVDTVIADLKGYIPERMRQAEVPGLSIALIRGGQVVWAAGFGIANTITGKPVTPTTVFEVASNSKVVTTYAALRLADQGKLSLDEPLAVYLREPWLPPSAYRDQVTLRHVASHSSGLTDALLPVDKRIAFEPGSAFSYSGVGFLYMQEAIEQVTGRSLEDVAREAVFEQLGMASSCFVNRADLVPRMANGHMAYSFPLLSFAVPFSVLLVVFLFVGIVILRIRTGRWRPTRVVWVGAIGMAALLTFLLIYATVGWNLPNVGLLIVLCVVVFGLVFSVVRFVGGAMIARLPEKHRRPLHLLWYGVSFVVLLWLSGVIAGPVLKGPSPPPSAVGSLRTTAPDLASFLIELAAPRHVSEEIASQIRTAQIPINEDFSWGLGVGIQHSGQGEALWQNGMTFGFRSVMVMYPEHHWGVVVLTNSHQGLPVAYDVAGRALGGKAHWIYF